MDVANGESGRGLKQAAETGTGVPCPYNGEMEAWVRLRKKSDKRSRRKRKAQATPALGPFVARSPLASAANLQWSATKSARLESAARFVGGLGKPHQSCHDSGVLAGRWIEEEAVIREALNGSNGSALCIAGGPNDRNRPELRI